MSKDIWHRYDEAPKHQDIIMTDTGFWAYRADLMALEPELKRTRKALDVAINAMKSAGTHNSINCIARGEDPSKDDVGITINHALAEITALEQKDK